MTGKFASNPYYVQYEELLFELSRLMSQGKGDMPEADAVREAMEPPYRQLTPDEIERLDGLSADLYMLEGTEHSDPLEPGESAESRASDRLGERLREAQGHWEAILRLLRKGTAGLSVPDRAYLRARAYEELGHFHAALLFIRYAADQDPQNQAYKFKILDLLNKLKRKDEKVAFAESLVRDEEAPPALVLQAAAILLESTRRLSQQEARPIREAVRTAVQSALDRLEGAPQIPVEFYRAYGHLTLGLCFEQLDRTDEALLEYDRALQVDPHDVGALVARAMLRVKLDPEELGAALPDFEVAVRSGVPIIAPYLHIAYHSLFHGAFLRCLDMCYRALAITGDERIQSVLWQWIALSRFEITGWTPEVHSAFSNAMQLDPLNLQIRHSYDVVRLGLLSGSSTSDAVPLWQLSLPTAIEGSSARVLQPVAA